MAINYSEKRNFIRMSTDSAMTVKLQGSNQAYQGRCRNLSASGVLFTIDQRFEPGTILHINITPEKAVVPPLDAMIEVVRALTDSNAGFAIAGQIKHIN